LTIGTFDGVHLGHQAVIRRAVELAAGLGLTSVVMTFDPHPRSSVGRGSAPPLVTCTPHKLRLIEELGVDACVLTELNDNLASMRPTDFVVEILHKRLRVAGLVVGPRSRFGKGRRGTPELLKRMGEKLGYWVEIVDEVFVGGVPVSSTMLRQSILEGELSTAESLLGRRYSIMGRVVRGRTVGRRLGFRTANINPMDQVVPPEGIYAVEVVVNGAEYAGALYIGRRPTFADGELPLPVLEVHILDFASPIYRKGIEVVFHRSLRDDRRFATLGELASQIKLDIDEVRRYFEGRMGCCSSRKVAQKRP
jgi:riboflavin kinase/FMN adenylyltransferase